MSDDRYFEETVAANPTRRSLVAAVVLVGAVIFLGISFTTLGQLFLDSQLVLLAAVLGVPAVALALYGASNLHDRIGSVLGLVESYEKWVTGDVVGYAVHGPDVTVEIPLHEIDQVQLMETAAVVSGSHDVLSRANRVQRTSLVGGQTSTKPQSPRTVVALTLYGGEELWFDTDRPTEFRQAIERAKDA
jgi:hypothetical protein